MRAQRGEGRVARSLEEPADRLQVQEDDDDEYGSDHTPSDRG